MDGVPSSLGVLEESSSGKAARPLGKPRVQLRRETCDPLPGVEGHNGRRHIGAALPKVNRRSQPGFPWDPLPGRAKAQPLSGGLQHPLGLFSPPRPLSASLGGLALGTCHPTLAPCIPDGRGLARQRKVEVARGRLLLGQPALQPHCYNYCCRYCQ